MRKLFFVLLTTVMVFTAEDPNVTDTNTSMTEMNLSEMMHQLNSVSDEERFILMNAIKRKLVKLKTEQRKEAIYALRTSMESNASDSNTTINERTVKEIKTIPQHLESRPEPPRREHRPEHRPPPRN